MKISFYSYANKTNFHMESFALSLAFVMRFTARNSEIIMAYSIFVNSQCAMYADIDMHIFISIPVS